MKEYNNVPLDGKPMKITLISSKETGPERTMSSLLSTRIGFAPVQQTHELNQPCGQDEQRNSFGGGRGAGGPGGRGEGGHGGRGAGGRREGAAGGPSRRGAGGRGTRGGPHVGRSGEVARKALTKEGLDAELDAYISKMNTNNNN